MKVYVASSWRNERQPDVVATLRAAGHEVYDFRHPEPNDGFAWSQIDPNWEFWTAREFRDALAHPLAVGGFESDRRALDWCDACVMVQPCGRSSALELGYAVGAGKLGVALLSGVELEPELMLKLAHVICVSVDEVIAALVQRAEGRGR